MNTVLPLFEELIRRDMNLTVAAGNALGGTGFNKQTIAAANRSAINSPNPQRDSDREHGQPRPSEVSETHPRRVGEQTAHWSV
jgi:hypothetical protein